jgi:hypothetical protein
MSRLADMYLKCMETNGEIIPFVGPLRGRLQVRLPAFALCKQREG